MVNFYPAVGWSFFLLLSVPLSVANSETVNSPFFRLADSAFSEEAPQAAGTHYVNVLETGDEALLARVHLIRSARQSVDIQTFLWVRDETTQYLAHELVKAAERGVRVRMIIDQIRSEKNPAWFAGLATAHPHFRIKHYNPSTRMNKPSAGSSAGSLALNFNRVNQRMHNKIFIVDNRAAITGGRNYENDYYDRGAERIFRDRDILIVGPVVGQMTRSFDAYWDFEWSVPCEDLLDVRKYVQKDLSGGSWEQKVYDPGLFHDINQAASDAVAIEGLFVEKSFKVNRVEFVVDAPGKSNTLGSAQGSVTGDALAEFLSGAEHSIIAQTPYLVLDKKIYNTLKALRKGHPDLDMRISTNSLASTDSIAAYAFSYKQKKRILDRLKLRVFEFKPVPKDAHLICPRFTAASGRFPEGGFLRSSYGEEAEETEEETFEPHEKHLVIHAKTYVVDSRSVWVGSFNLDPRSVHINTEVGLILWDEQVAQAIEKQIVRDMAPRNSWASGKRKSWPLVSDVSDLISDISRILPVIDPWPFNRTSNFELNDGARELPFYHKDFHENYRPVGSFPTVGFSIKTLRLRFLKTLAGFVEHIV